MPAKARHLKPNQLLHELGEIDLAHVAVVHQGYARMYLHLLADDYSN